MNDTPLTGWALLMVGHHWPGTSSLTVIAAVAEDRHIKSALDDSYADALQQTRVAYLEQQEGVTASSVSNKFEFGESLSRRLAFKNGAKAQAYRSAGAATRQLRAELTEIAEDGEKQVTEVLQSGVPAQSKVQRIVEIVIEGQSRANIAAARQSNNVIDAIQNLLVAQDIGMSARQFIEAKGLSLEGQFGSRDPSILTSQVESMMNSALSPPKTPSRPLDASGLAAKQAPPPESMRRGSSDDGLTNMNGANEPFGDQSVALDQGSTAHSPHPARLESLETRDWSVNSAMIRRNLTEDLGATAVPATNARPTIPQSAPYEVPSTPPSTTNVAPPTSASSSAPGPTAQSQSPPIAPSSSITAASEAPGSPGTPAHPTTNTLAADFDAGFRAGAPLSTAAEAVITSGVGFHAQPVPAPPITDAPIQPGSAMVFETAHPVQPTAAPGPDTAHAVVGTPAAVPPAPVAPPITPPPVAAATPPTGLLGYGADLRAATTTAAAPSPAAPVSAPGAAPLNPAGSLAGPGQTAVVRQPPSAALSAPASPVSVAENALAATASGAAKAADIANFQAGQRLTRLLHAVARQEPRLRWIIGDLPDGTTVVATDLAGGWIPPNIDIPTGVTLVPPAPPGGDLHRLLGPTTLAVSYRPGDHLAAGEPEPVSMSVRARDIPPVAELAWELAQATKWRDGLPRLAHTIVKAVFARTGYLDSEVALLREHVSAVGARVLTAYPDDVGPAQVADWQLLCTIDALVNDRTPLAGYHFAWFRAHAPAAGGEAVR